MAPADPPKWITFGPIKVRVKDDDATLRKRERSHGEALMGVFVADECEIALCPTLQDQQRRSVLLHECLHALVDQTALDGDLLAGEAQEQLVSRLTPALLDMLRRNPELVAYLCSMTENKDERSWTHYAS